MKLLRETIRRILLEGAAKDEFFEEWYGSYEADHRLQFDLEDESMIGTHHKDSLKRSEYGSNSSDEEIDGYFNKKRDLKRTWNETIDSHGLRSFWEGTKVKYYHSLAYYGNIGEASDDLDFHAEVNTEPADLSTWGFFKLYGKANNKNEMSTFGVYPGKHMVTPHNQKLGVIISGRVTLASSEDAFTESRSRTTGLDTARHQSSGLPKRMTANDEMVNTLLFDEQNIIKHGIGECILDNWSIEAIVCNSNALRKVNQQDVIKGAKTLAKQYGVPLIESSMVFK